MLQLGIITTQQNSDVQGAGKQSRDSSKVVWFSGLIPSLLGYAIS